MRSIATPQHECAVDTPTSVEGPLAALQRLGTGARVIAGGHSLLPMMKLPLAEPEHVIDINDVTELAYIREQDGEIRIPAPR
jgi:aerobic carbon-monoxide dehydrogenase medium subunit